MRKEKGITLVALLITIVIMILLAGVTISVTTDMQEQINFEAFKTHLDILQTEVIEKYESISDEMKEIDSFETYTPEELVSMGFSEVDQNVYINWKTRQVKMYYKGQEYYSDKYNIQSNNIQENETDFDIDIEYFENRYKVTVKPKENKNGLEVSYRLKVGEGQAENNWILANGLEFEYVNYGIYEVRLADKNGNETIKTIEQTLETVASEGEMLTLYETKRERLIKMTIYGDTLDGINVGANGNVNVVITGKNLINVNMNSGYYNHIDGTIVLPDSSIYVSTETITLPAGTYTVSSENNVGIVRLLKKGVELEYNEFNGYTNLPYTFNIDEEMEIGFSFRDSKSSTANWTYGSTTKEARIQLERSDTNTEYEEYEEKVYNIKLYEEIPKDSSKTIQLDDYQMYTYESITNIYVEDENLGRIPFEVAYIKTEILE